MAASQSRSSFCGSHRLRRPAGLHSRRYAKLPTLVRACQPPALPSRFASYVQSPVALVVCWRCGICQALCAWLQLAASPCILCVPPPTLGACLLRSIARAVCPSAPQGGSLRTALASRRLRRRPSGRCSQISPPTPNRLNCANPRNANCVGWGGAKRLHFNSTPNFLNHTE